MLKNILFVICILVPFILGYGFLNTWWQFIPSTVLIVLLTKVFYPSHWKTYLGVSITFKDFVLSILFCIFFTAIAHLAIKLSLPKDYSLGRDTYWGYFSYVNNLFQCLNEEFIFRALLLNFLLSLGLGKWKVVLIPALIFSLLHWCFYSFNYLPENRGSVNFSALMTLFLFGFSTGLIFIKTRSIMIPLALHCGWNFNRFSMGIFKIDAPQERISEYLSFNLLEGSDTVFILCLGLAICSYLICEGKITVFHKR